MNQRNLENHVPIVGWVHIAIHAINIFIGLAVFMLLFGIGFATGEAEAGLILTVVGIFVGVILVALALPGIIAGYGLLKRKSWGRMLAIIVAILGLLNFPLGTAVGIYSLWVLLPEDAAPYFAEPKPAF